jgi:hypothetical protein
MDFNIDELSKVQKSKEETKKEVYDIILERAVKRVKFINKNSNAKKIWFLVPSIIPGKPIFNMEDCVIYLVSKLREMGFESFAKSPNHIFISWEITGEKPKASDLSSGNQKKGPPPKKPTELNESVDMLSGLNFNLRKKI